jgi:hypothetical protein
LDLEAVSGENDVVLSDVKGTATITAKGLDSVSLEGAANRTQRFEWKLGKEGGARTLALRANNGGALIRFAGLTGRSRTARWYSTIGARPRRRYGRHGDA